MNMASPELGLLPTAFQHQFSDPVEQHPNPDPCHFSFSPRDLENLHCFLSLGLCCPLFYINQDYGAGEVAQ